MLDVVVLDVDEDDDTSELRVCRSAVIRPNGSALVVDVSVDDVSEVLEADVPLLEGGAMDERDWRSDRKDWTSAASVLDDVEDDDAEDRSDVSVCRSVET